VANQQNAPGLIISATNTFSGNQTITGRAQDSPVTYGNVDDGGVTALITGIYNSGEQHAEGAIKSFGDAEQDVSDGNYGTAALEVVQGTLNGVSTVGSASTLASPLAVFDTAPVVAAQSVLPDGMGIGIVQDWKVIEADLTVATSHEALAAKAGVLGANKTLTGGAQAITWFVDNGVIRTVSSINFPSTTGPATEEAVKQFLQVLLKTNGGG
jgi:hypothetical protein